MKIKGFSQFFLHGNFHFVALRRRLWLRGWWAIWNRFFDHLLIRYLLFVLKIHVLRLEIVENGCMEKS